MMTGVSIATNMAILRNCPKARKDLVDEVVKELNAMNAWPDLDGPNDHTRNPTIPLN